MVNMKLIPRVVKVFLSIYIDYTSFYLFFISRVILVFMTQDDTLKMMKMGKNVFLTGPAGSGKTHVLKMYINYLNKNGVNVAVTASTGIAATHLGGMTIHSWTGLGIKDNLTEYDLELMEEKQYLWKRFKKTSVLIIDEVSMISSNMLTMIDRVCRHMKRNSEPFGGMQIILSGDFFQLPPIMRRQQDSQYSQEYLDSEDSSAQHFAFSSPSWEDADIHICYLDSQYRQTDSVLLEILTEMRTGEISKKSKKHLQKRMVSTQDPNITRLYTHNLNVDSFNEKCLMSIKGEEKKYTMFSKGKPSLVDALKRGCLAPETLIIRVGSKVMFVKNNPVQGYVNGTTGEVTGFNKNSSPIVKTSTGKIYTAEPQTWMIEEDGKVLAEISQIPLRLAWAITVHKSQGMTLDKAYVDLSKAFEKGQGYVAISRLQKLEGLFLLGINDEAFCAHPNIVERDIHFQNISDSYTEMFGKMTNDEVEKYIHDFIKKHGESKNKKSSEPQKTTFEITKDCLKSKLTIDEIVDERELSKDTVIGHIEKLLSEGMIEYHDLEYLRPKSKSEREKFEEIISSFKKQMDNNLKPVFLDLNKKYDYDYLKFVRLFVD